MRRSASSRYTSPGSTNCLEDKSLLVADLHYGESFFGCWRWDKLGDSKYSKRCQAKVDSTIHDGETARAREKVADLIHAPEPDESDADDEPARRLTRTTTRSLADREPIVSARQERQSARTPRTAKPGR